MNREISSDKPVRSQEEDRFQRYGFAARIARKIMRSKNNDCITIGIYGKWGDGKTSVNNFIENELKEQQDVITIKFNPWIFNEESQLLRSFFETVAKEIKKNTGSDRERKVLPWGLSKLNRKKSTLKTSTENIGDLLLEYGQLASIIGGGKFTEAVGRAISNVDLLELRERFEKLLIENQKKLVIFMDDIDRLDKQEIHSIFRLVKLSADFANTFYILSFDRDMVASAIGERFGRGDYLSGLNFLEKIIQVPLELPKANTEALKDYCLNGIDKVLKDEGIELGEPDAQRFVYAFTSHVLSRLKNPRMATRYGNSLSFSLPLLKGEVNIVDLMFVEALKIFYPNHYQLVRDNPEYFTISYRKSSDLDMNDEKGRKEELTGHLERLGKGLGKKEVLSVKKLLIEMFPVLNGAFHNSFYHEGEILWAKDKRIVSKDYFKRYFSLSVIRGEVSDIKLEEFIESLSTKTHDDILLDLNGLIDSSSVSTVVYKLRLWEDGLDWEASKKLISVIVSNGHEFPDSFSFRSFGYDSPLTQASILIYSLFKNNLDKDGQFEFAKEIFRIADPVEMDFEILRWLKLGKPGQERLFSEGQYIELQNIIRERCFALSGDVPIFVDQPDRAYRLLSFWKDEDPKAVEDYLRGILEKEPKLVLDLIVSLTSKIRSSEEPDPYRVDFEKENYTFLTSLLDRDFIHGLIESQYGNEVSKEDVMFVDKGNIQTDVNILRQFKHWYKSDIDKL